ncbi:MAG TPA: glycosyltransferase family protein [Myxococcota bacterium]
MSETNTSTQPMVIFALSSEGMGHATRAAPVITALRERGYRVEVYCGGRVAQYLRDKTAGEVHEHFFIPLIYTNNALDIRASLAYNFARIVPCLKQVWAMFWKMRKEKPVAVISDFEFMSAWTGWWSGTPVIGLDNMHVITHGNIPEPLTKLERQEKKNIAAAIWWNGPVLDRILITSFFQPGLKPGVDANKVRYVPCATRPEVLSRRSHARTDGPVLVYQTSSTNDDLPGTLSTAAVKGNLRFVVYGTKRTGTDDSGRVEYRAFSEAGFLDDMAAAPFVIVNGGHSTMVEALALGKPVLSEPIQKQYEQQANATGLELMGVGQGVRKMTADAILSFAQRVPAMAEKAAQLTSLVDNDALVRAVEDTLHDVAPGRALPPRNVVSIDSYRDAFAMAAE